MYPNTYKVSKEARGTESCWSWIHNCLRGYWELNLGPLEYQDMSQVLSYLSRLFYFVVMIESHCISLAGLELPM